MFGFLDRYLRFVIKKIAALRLSINYLLLMWFFFFLKEKTCYKSSLYIKWNKCHWAERFRLFLKNLLYLSSNRFNLTPVCTCIQISQMCRVLEQLPKKLCFGLDVGSSICVLDAALLTSVSAAGHGLEWTPNPINLSFLSKQCQRLALLPWRLGPCKETGVCLCSLIVVSEMC